MTVLFPFKTYLAVNKELTDPATWRPGRNVPDYVPPADDMVKNAAKRKFGEKGEDAFVIWAALNSMFQELHYDSWPVAVACSFGLMGEPVNMSLLDAPPTEALALFVAYSGVISRETGKDLSDDVTALIRASCAYNGDAVLPEVLAFAADDDAERQFRANATDQEKEEAARRASAIDEMVSAYLRADAIKE